jgi:hypothetical protein
VIEQPGTSETGAGERGSRRQTTLVAGIIVLLALAAIAGGGWWYFMGRAEQPDWERVPDIVLGAPAGDGFLADTPWVAFAAAPMIPGEPNTLRLSLAQRQGTPAADAGSVPRITAATGRPLATGEVRTLALQPEANANGAMLVTDAFDEPGWWQFSVTVEGATEEAVFYLLLPDPNVNGPRSVEQGGASSEGEALYQRGLQALTSLQSVRYVQWLADGRGNAAIAEHAVTAGGDGRPPGFTYHAAGGMEAVVIGSTRWVKLPGDLGWTRQEGAMSVPPADWGEEYAGATGFTILGDETIDGVSTRLLSFVVPEVSEPRRQTAAWYLWWIDTERGYIVEEAMVSRVHYMHNSFSDFDVPLDLVPPDEAATPTAATPIP